MNDYRQRERFAELHLPCPCGRSSDAFCLRQDGSGFCFSCGEDFQNNVKEQKTGLDQKIDFEIRGFRNISKSTAQFYGVETKIVDGEEFERGFPFGESAAKIKNIADKKIQKSIGDFREAGLFGMDRFDNGSKEAIIITEGEEDAMAAYEMMRYKFAAESLKNGAQSTRDLSRRDIWDHINSFDKIYFCFDNDAQGHAAVKAVQGVFDFRKTYHVKLTRHKDANEYLKNHESDGFEKAVLNAKRFAPDNIISSFDDIRKALKQETQECLCTYPFPDLQDRTYGIFEEEVIVVKADTGVGKTEFLRALEHHVLKETGYPLGIIHLEENNSVTIRAIAGYELGKPATLPSFVTGLTEDEIFEAYKAAVKEDGRVHIYQAFDVEDEQAFYGSIRFLAGAAGCKIVCFDHISWMATGLDEDEDERRKLDRIAQRLKLLAKELKFALIMVSHTNDDGKTRGSRNIAKVGNTMITLTRDDSVDETMTSFYLDKVRLGGRRGPAGCAYFNRETGRLEAERPDPILGEDDEDTPKTR